MKKRFLCIWVPGLYTPEYEEHDQSYFTTDRGFEEEEIELINELEIGKQIEFECLYVIRLD